VDADAVQSINEVRRAMKRGPALGDVPRT